MTKSQCPMTGDRPSPNDQCPQSPDMTPFLGHWSLGIHWSLDIGHWSFASVIGHFLGVIGNSLVIGHWSLVISSGSLGIHWSLDIGHWSFFSFSASTAAPFLTLFPSSSSRLIAL